jgi:hypothetical protein
MDVREVQDIKVLSAASYASIAVVAGEAYNSVLTKVVDRLPSAAQKLALDSTLSIPSATNPVVLKDDLSTYIPDLDLGEVKDSVQNFVDLPLVGNTLGDLRSVIADNVIYRWNGTAWTEFIRSGTFIHTELTNQNGDPQYQHLTTANLATLNAQTHLHTNLTVLNGITDVGSGNIITTAERNRIPTPNQVDALKGTYGFPSNINRYVTHQDPRLNTVRNPYVTVGPPASLATYMGVDSIPFEQALFALDVGSATAVKAIEILPGTYTFLGTPLVWNNPAPLLIEAVPGTVTLNVGVNGFKAAGAGGPLTIRGVNFVVTNYTTFAALTQRPGSVFEDCTFTSVPLNNTQIGLVLEAAHCTVRRCTFNDDFLDAIQVKGDHASIEGCTFDLLDATHPGVHVLPGYTNTKVVGNTFLSGIVFPEGSYAEVLDNFLTTWVKDFGVGTRALGNMPEQYNQPYSGITKTIGPLNSYADYRSDDETGFLAAFNDCGTSSKYACTISVAIPAIVNTAAVDLFKTGGRVYFTGSLPAPLVENTMYYVTKVTSTTFKIAATPGGPFINTTLAGSGTIYVHNGIVTFEVLPGTYTFSTTVDIPVSVRLKGGDATFVAASAPAFKLFSAAGVEGLTFNSAYGVSAQNATGAVVEKCSFTTTDYGVDFNTCTDSVVRGCSFGGTNGYHSIAGTRNVIEGCIFSSSSLPLRIETGSNIQVRDNFFTSSPMPQVGVLGITDSIIEGNHFLGTLPTKANTTNSIWQSNYPMSANNIDGVDEFIIDLMGYLEPVTPLSLVGSIANTASLEFDAVNTSSAATAIIPISALVRTDSPFTVELIWTSTGTSGVVKWEATSVFVDSVAGVLVASSSVADVSNRVGSTTSDINTLNLVNNTYNATGVSHVAVTISRKGADPQDTMSQSAHLIGARIRLPRD